MTENYLNGQSGEISSPMYPNLYRDSDDYSWTIAVNQGNIVQIVLKEFLCTSFIHHLKVSKHLNELAFIIKFHF